MCFLGVEPFSWAGWNPVVMAVGPGLPNVPHPFCSGCFLFGDIRSCSPELSGFLADLTGFFSMACISSASPLSFCDEDFPGNILLVVGHDWLYIALGGGAHVHLGLRILELGPQLQEDQWGKLLCVGRSLREWEEWKVGEEGVWEGTNAGSHFLWEL